MSDIVIKFRETTAALWPRELDALLHAQRVLVTTGTGVLGLTSDLAFLFAYRQDGWKNIEFPIGVLAVRDWDNGGIWVQIAFTDPDCRRQKVFTRLVGELERMAAGRPIGFGVNASNFPMVEALKRLGYEAPKLYFEKPGPAVPSLQLTVPAACAPASE